MYANVYRHSFWKYSKRFHAFDSSYDIIYRNLLGEHPVLSGHHSIPPGRPVPADLFRKRSPTDLS